MAVYWPWPLNTGFLWGWGKHCTRGEQERLWVLGSSCEQNGVMLRPQQVFAALAAVLVPSPQSQTQELWAGF